MTTISPTRVSMYDFLYQDIQPMIPLLADGARLSLPQTRLALSSGLQATISALLVYQQQHQGQAVFKKLFNHSATKEVRGYNSMNFTTFASVLYHRHDMAAALFSDNLQINTASSYIAQQIDAAMPQVQTLLTSLCVIVVRELAILADYSQLDNEEINKWFELQPQFLSAERFRSIHSPVLPTVALADNTENTNHRIHDDSNPVDQDQHTNLEKECLLDKSYPLPAFDPYWFELTQFTPHNTADQPNLHQATSHYLKVIGRSAENIQQGRHNDMLVFIPMTAIAVPHQRWLLQLAKISDIYLSRNRLRITSEPKNPPTRPLVNLLFTGNNSDDKPTMTSKTTQQNDTTIPLWKTPVIIILIVVMVILSALATFKYQKQKSYTTLPTPTKITAAQQ